jgi:hypothetical protein
MTLTRKPRTGDQLEHIANWGEVANGTEAPRVEPLGRVTSTDGNMCWYEHTERNETSCFIWQNASGLNKAVSVV